MLKMRIGPAIFTTEFRVIDIPSSFNLLLGRVWLHEVGALPSSLHQKIKIPYNGDIIVIKGDPERTIAPKETPVLGIGSQDVQLGGFSYEPKVQMLITQKVEYLPTDDMPTVSTHVVQMMRKMKFLPGIGLGRYQAGISQAIKLYHQPSFFAGLGYMGNQSREKTIVLHNSSLNGYFVKEGEEFSYCGFQEPWTNGRGQRQPGLEIFFEEDLYIKE